MAAAQPSLFSLQHEACVIVKRAAAPGDQGVNHSETAAAALSSVSAKWFI